MTPPSNPVTWDQLLFVGFNSRVAAIHRDNGHLIWQWKSPKGSGYTTVLLDGDRLIVSVIGYTYCLDPLTGEQWWANELPGMGTGVATIASIRGTAGNPALAASSDADTAAAASSTSTPVHG